MASNKKAPTPYQPAGQAQADAGYQGAASSLYTAGQQLTGQVTPQLQNITNSVINNPYYAQAQAGADQAAAIGSGYVAPSQFAGAHGSQTLADQAAAAANPYYQQMMAAGQGAYTGAMAQLPGTLAGLKYAPGILEDALAKAQQSYGQAQSLIPGTTDLTAANRVLGTGFDPQGELYDREYQKMLEQRNAINSASGVATSPFGAGIAGQASTDFNLDWQNQQLARQIAALGAYNTSTSTAAGNMSTLLGAGSSAYGNLVNTGVNGYTGLTDSAYNNYNNVLNSGVGALASLGGQAVNGFTGLANTALNGYGQASNLGAAGLNTLTTAANYPNQVYLQQQQSQLDAIQAQIEATVRASGLTGQAADAYAKYLQLGQSATAGAQNAAQINNASSANMWKGIGSLAAVAAAPFTGGASLAFAGGMGGGGGGGIAGGGWTESMGG